MKQTIDHSVKRLSLRRRLPVAILAAATAFIFFSSAATAATGKLNVTIDSKTKALTAAISFENDFQVKSFTLDNPPRFIVDATPALLPNGGVVGGETFPVSGSKAVKSIRLAQNSRNPDIARIVLDLNEKVSFNVQIETGNHKLIIRQEGTVVSALPPVDSPYAVRLQSATLFNFKTGSTNPGFTATPVYNEDGSFTLKVAFPGYSAAKAGKTLPVDAGIIENISWKQDGKNAYAFLRMTVPTNFALEYKADDGTLALTVRQPELLGKRICIDPGHGAKDPGTMGRDGTTEKSIVLDVALRLKSLLNAAGADVVMTRRDDTFIPLAVRAEIANSSGCNLFVSIHGNALPNHDNYPNKRGIQVFYYTDSSKDYATAMFDEMNTLLGIGDLGMYARNLYVTRNARMPAVLVELAFLSHYADLALLKTSEFRENCARSLYNGLEAQLGMSAARLPAVELPMEVASYVLRKPSNSIKLQVCEAEPTGNPTRRPAFAAASEGVDDSLFDDIPVPARKVAAPTSAPAVEAMTRPVLVEVASAAPALKRVRKPRTIQQRYPLEPWNRTVVPGGSVSLNP